MQCEECGHNFGECGGGMCPECDHWNPIPAHLLGKRPPPAPKKNKRRFWIIVLAIVALSALLLLLARVVPV
jgi:predicted ATP-dependent serine protease